jgi:HK97 family phage prohead protease
MTVTVERSMCLRAVEFRATDEATDGRTLEGYAAVFDTPTRIQSWEGEFDEEIARGAFRKTLKKRKPVMQYDHGRDARTGTVPIGSIEDLREDEQGLYVLGRLFDNDVIEPVRQAIEGKAITGMSIRFAVAREQWSDRDGKKVKEDELPRLLWEPGDRGPLKRSILEVDPLFELGPVVFAAYDTTSVGVRSLLAQLGPEDHRALLRELAAELRRADPELTEQLVARSAGGGDLGTQPRNGEVPPNPARSRVDDDALRLRGILK